MDAANIVENSIGRKLKHFRKIKNFSQENLAELSGISLRTIQRIESGGSLGSAYTIDKLSLALGVDVSEFIVQEKTMNDDLSVTATLKLLNLSTLAVVLIPLSNIVVPLIILRRNKHLKTLQETGRRIITFQIFWTLVTMVVMILLPVFLLLFQPFRGVSIPLFVPIYYCCLLVNIYYILRTAAAINKQQPLFVNLPNIM